MSTQISKLNCKITAKTHSDQFHADSLISYWFYTCTKREISQLHIHKHMVLWNRKKVL